MILLIRSQKYFINGVLGGFVYKQQAMVNEQQMAKGARLKRSLRTGAKSEDGHENNFFKKSITFLFRITIVSS